MAYNNYSNPIPFKWPWASQDETSAPAQGTSQSTAAFTFPSNMAQKEEDQPQPTFNQPQVGAQRGARQFAPSFGAASGGGAGFKRFAGGSR